MNTRISRSIYLFVALVALFAMPGASRAPAPAVATAVAAPSPTPTRQHATAAPTVTLTTPTPYNQDTQHSAFPSIARLANGSLLTVYRQGSNHFQARDGFIRSTTSIDAGKTWSEPSTIVPPRRSTDYRDPSVSTSTDGSTLYLTYFKGTEAVGAAGSFFRSSVDGGHTWTHEVRIDPHFPWSAITAPAVQLADRSIATVHYSKKTGETFDSVWLSRSSDNGATWKTTRLVNGPSTQRDYQEPYLVRKGAGLFLTFRWGNHDSIGSTVSTDSGATWTNPTASFAGTGRPSSAWLSNGALVVYVRDFDGNFDLRVTRDTGKTWSSAYKVQAPPAGGMSTYASFVETSPGNVFTVMTAEDKTGAVSRISFENISVT